MMALITRTGFSKLVLAFRKQHIFPFYSSLKLRGRFYLERAPVMIPLGKSLARTYLNKNGQAKFTIP